MMTVHGLHWYLVVLIQQHVIIIQKLMWMMVVVIMTVSLVLVALLFYPPCPSGPIYGCTDELACNYNESADIEDGSCIYSLVVSHVMVVHQ